MVHLQSWHGSIRDRLLLRKDSGRDQSCLAAGWEVDLPDLPQCGHQALGFPTHLACRQKLMPLL
jgi:hypothetical protein